MIPKIIVTVIQYVKDQIVLSRGGIGVGELKVL